MTDEQFSFLRDKSRAVHGHMDVLPVAAWVSGKNGAVGPPEAGRGLDGRVATNRIIEALQRLVDLGAMTELTRGPARNAPRFFERCEDPYWDLVAAYAAEARAGARSSPSRLGATP